MLERPAFTSSTQTNPTHIGDVELDGAPHAVIILPAPHDGLQEHRAAWRAADLELQQLSHELTQHLDALIDGLEGSAAWSEPMQQQPSTSNAAHKESSPRQPKRKKAGIQPLQKDCQAAGPCLPPSRTVKQRKEAPTSIGKGRLQTTASSAVSMDSIMATSPQTQGTGREQAAPTFTSEMFGPHTLLTREHEVELTEIVKDALLLEAVQSDLKAILKRSPSKQEWGKAVGMPDVRAFDDRLQVGQAAKHVMLRQNIRLVHHICRGYQNRGVDYEDLVAAGIKGLLRAVEKFDGKKGVKFSTYAHWWIRQGLLKVIRAQTRVVRLPDHVFAEVVLVRSVRGALREELNQEPSMRQLADKLKMAVPRVSELLAMSIPTTSLDLPSSGTGEEESDALGNTIQDLRDTPDQAMDDTMLHRDLKAFMSQVLRKREYQIFMLRVEQRMSLHDIAVRFKLSGERVRQIEKEALKKLKGKKLMQIAEEYSHKATEADGKLTARSSLGTMRSR